jgi:hypothetical protein
MVCSNKRGERKHLNEIGVFLLKIYEAPMKNNKHQIKFLMTNKFPVAILFTFSSQFRIFFASTLKILLSIFVGISFLFERKKKKANKNFCEK